MTVIEESANSDSDEYLPQPTPPPKLNKKRKPSAIRIAAQHHKKQHPDHDIPERDNDIGVVKNPRIPNL